MANAKFKIKKGDQVVVLTGRDKGAKGEVVEILTQERKVIVRGVNVVTKNQKPTQTSPGGQQKQEMALHVSNVALADPKSGKPSRVGFKVLKDGKKVRVAKKSGDTVE